MVPKLKNSRKRKTGKEFERLITKIQESVHEKAIITPNDKLIDLDTGKPRQIDITIRLSDGPTEFLGIVEVRDRSRPIGVRYVEEIWGKRNSVGADAAFLVSRSGFAKTALSKAEHLGIRTFSFEEANEANWSNWVQCRYIIERLKRFGNVVLQLFEKSTRKGITLSEDTRKIFEADKNNKIIFSEQGDPFLSSCELIQQIFNQLGGGPFQDIPQDGTKVRVTFPITVDPTTSIWVKAKNNRLVPVGHLYMTADLYWEIRESPIRLYRFMKAGSESSIVEMLSAQIESSGKKYMLNLLAEGADETIQGPVRVSLSPVNENQG